MPSRDQPIRFVVLGTARSGTSLLTSTLNQHPEIYCHGEIFHPRAEINILSDFRAQADLDARVTEPVAFAYSVLNFANGKAAVGFKMWRGQSREACDALLSDSSIKKIILERKNKLAQFSSGSLARKSGVWNVKAGTNVTKLRAIKASFSVNDFRNFMNKNGIAYQYYQEQAIGPVLYLDYSRITSVLHSVLEFLGVSVVPLPAWKERLHSSDILSRFDARHHETIIAILDEIGRPDWRYENVDDASPLTVQTGSQN